MGTLSGAVGYLLRVSVWQLDFAFDPSLAGDPKWWTAAAAVAAVAITSVSAVWAVHQWRIQYLISQWHETVEFLYEHPEFLDVEKNKDYKRAYEGAQAVEYELIARRSIAYVDDLFALRMQRQLKSWLSGSLDLFVAPHQAWFHDHHAAYSRKFREAVANRLPQANQPSDG